MATGSLIRVGIASCCLTLLIPLVARSQGTQPSSTETDGPEGVLDEIVVTARRRSENLQDVPISIVSRSGEYLEQSQVESMTELDRVVPGFVFKEYESGGQSTMGIRGLSTFSESGAQQSVGMVVDGVVLEAIGTAVTNFNDVERIEVLRGPQGTLFGRNTTGGVVHIVTREPVDEFEADLSASYGSYDEVKWNGTISGPLAEDWAARASAFTANREGHVENIHDGRMLGADEQAGLRTKFLFTSNDGTRLLLGMHYVQRHQEGVSSGGGQPVVGFGPFASDTSRQVNADIVAPENDKVNGVGYHAFDDEIAGINLTWDQSIGEHTLTSITAYEYWQWDFGEDENFRTFNDPVEPLALVKFYAASKLNAWSQELRLASPSERRLEYVVGAFTSGSKATAPIDFLINISGDPDPAAAIYLFDDEVAASENMTYAFFGEGDFHLTDEWTLTAGTRWTYDKTDTSNNSRTPPGFIPEFGIGIGPLGEIYVPFLGSEVPGFREGSVSADSWSWRGGLRWEPSPDVMLYSTIARGFKGPAISSVSGAFTEVAPEIATSYEVGVKTGFLDDRLLAALTVFRADVDDFQAEGTDNIQTPQGTVLQIILKNAGEVRTQGVEFQLSAVSSENLSFDLGFAYIDAKYVSFTGASCYASQTLEEGCIPIDPTNPESAGAQDLSGKRLPFTPEWSGNAVLNYDFSIPGWETTQTLRLDYTYQSEINWNLGLAPLNESDPVGVWGASLGITSPDDRFEVVGYVKNLTDEYVVNGLNGGNEAISANLQPDYQRTCGVSFNYKVR